MDLPSDWESTALEQSSVHARPADLSRALLSKSCTARDLWQTARHGSDPHRSRTSPAELVTEIKDAARRQLGEVGAPALSLRAVARDLGMVSSAIYRYFPSRDDLLTALIVDAYDSLGARGRARPRPRPARPAPTRWPAGRHLPGGRWALANQHEYALIFGSPVPGYRAPQETVSRPPASRC